MKVVFVDPVLYPAHYGFYEALAHRCELTVLTGRVDKARFGKAGEAVGYRIRPLKTLFLPRLLTHPAGFREEFALQLPLDLVAQLSKEKPDIVYSREMGARTLLCWAWCKLANRPMVIGTCMSDRTEQRRGYLRLFIRRFLLSRGHLVTFNGQSCLDYLRGIGASSDLLRYLPYTVSEYNPFEGGRKRAAAPHLRKLLYVGQLTKRKGVEGMLAQLSGWCDRNRDRTLYLTLLGDGPLRKLLERTDYPANLHLDFRGNCDREQLRDEYLRHSALIFPTLADEWGLVVNEALHSGLCVLASIYSQAATELIRPGATGWLYCPDRAEELHKVLDTYFQMPESQFEEMGRAARQSVSHLTADYTAEKAYEILCEAVERQRSSKRRFRGY